MIKTARLLASCGPDTASATEAWLERLGVERRCSAHTLSAYRRDICQFFEFLREHLGGAPTLAIGAGILFFVFGPDHDALTFGQVTLWIGAAAGLLLVRWWGERIFVRLGNGYLRRSQHLGPTPTTNTNREARITTATCSSPSRTRSSLGRFCGFPKM